MSETNSEVETATMASDFTNSTVVTSHYSNDVIFGRGHGISSWPGNVAFRHTVWKYRQKYAVARRRERREIGRTVVRETKSLNGRFLIINSQTGKYHEVSKKRAEDKACQSLREKHVKMPAGFDFNAMKSRKRWFRSLINNPTKAHPQDSVSNTINRTLLDDRKSCNTINASKRSDSEYPLVQPATAKRGRKQSVALSAPRPNHWMDHKVSGKHFILDEGPIEYNEILHGDDMSLITLDHSTHPNIPFLGESNVSVQGFGDDNSVLVDLKQWPDPTI
jgi:hypothetical protein